MGSIPGCCSGKFLASQDSIAFRLSLSFKCELNWYQVTSSDIAAIAYDETSQTLGIEFLKGGTYEYFDFPASLFDQFLGADSKGKFFHAFIKGQFRYAKVA